MIVAEAAVLPPIVLQQQKAIDAALTLAAGWDKKAAALQATAEYTRVHGNSLVADRYAMRGHNLTGMAADLRAALQMTEEIL